jgi:hypothetical protein
MIPSLNPQPSRPQPRRSAAPLPHPPPDRSTDDANFEKTPQIASPNPGMNPQPHESKYLTSHMLLHHPSPNFASSMPACAVSVEADPSRTPHRATSWCCQPRGAKRTQSQKRTLSRSPRTHRNKPKTLANGAPHAPGHRRSHERISEARQPHLRLKLRSTVQIRAILRFYRL